MYNKFIKGIIEYINTKAYKIGFLTFKDSFLLVRTIDNSLKLDYCFLLYTEIHELSVKSKKESPT